MKTVVFIHITDAVQSFVTVLSFLKLMPVAPVFLSSQQPAIKETQTYWQRCLTLPGSHYFWQLFFFTLKLFFHPQNIFCVSNTYPPVGSQCLVKNSCCGQLEICQIPMLKSFYSLKYWKENKKKKNIKTFLSLAALSININWKSQVHSEVVDLTK